MFERLYFELRAVAAGVMRGERNDHTLQATALVHEAFLRLVVQRAHVRDNRRQFIAIAARMMRRVLVDHARGRLRRKRGGGAVPVLLEALDAYAPPCGEGNYAIEAALRGLEAMDPRKAAVVRLHWFRGLSLEATAEVLACSIASVTRDWRFAKAYLARALRD